MGTFRGIGLMYSYQLCQHTLIRAYSNHLHFLLTEETALDSLVVGIPGIKKERERGRKLGDIVGYS